MNVSRRIKKLRKAAGMSVQELAVKSKLTRQGLYLIEGGKVSPRGQTLTKLARGLRTTVSNLVRVVAPKKKAA